MIIKDNTIIKISIKIINITPNQPKIDTILMSIQHDPDFDETEFKRYIKEEIMDAVVRKYNLNTDYNKV